LMSEALITRRFYRRRFSRGNPRAKILPERDKIDSVIS
jgi:hypothetical protein